MAKQNQSKGSSVGLGKRLSASASTPSRWRRRLAIPVFMLGGLLLFIGVGFLTITNLEDHDSFCASCHTVPESTYVDRSVAAKTNTAAPITDLASMHFRQAHDKNNEFLCINCHRGDSGLIERIQTVALGARDTLILWTGKADPTIEKPTIQEPFLVNAACVSCHETTLLTVKGLQSHFHNFLPQTADLIIQGKSWIGVSTNGRQERIPKIDIPLTCTSCHLAHKTVDASDPRLKLVDKTIAEPQCNVCHRAVGERSQRIDRLFSGRDG